MCRNLSHELQSKKLPFGTWTRSFSSSSSPFLFFFACWVITIIILWQTKSDWIEFEWNGMPFKCNANHNKCGYSFVSSWPPCNRFYVAVCVNPLFNGRVYARARANHITIKCENIAIHFNNKISMYAIPTINHNLYVKTKEKNIFVFNFWRFLFSICVCSLFPVEFVRF